MNGVREVDLMEWDNFVMNSPQGTVFSTSQWLKLIVTPHELPGVAVPC